MNGKAFPTTSEESARVVTQSIKNEFARGLNCVRCSDSRSRRFFGPSTTIRLVLTFIFRRFFSVGGLSRRFFSSRFDRSIFGLSLFALGLLLLYVEFAIKFFFFFFIRSQSMLAICVTLSKNAGATCASSASLSACFFLSNTCGLFQSFLQRIPFFSYPLLFAVQDAPL